MSSYTPLILLVSLFLALLYFGYIRDMHDQELRETVPGHSRYGATLRETAVWWWRSSGARPS